MKHGHVADGDVVADVAAVICGEVEDGAVLDIGAAADGDGVDVAAEDGVVPDAGVFSDGDIAEDDSAFGDEGGGVDGWGAEEMGWGVHGSL